MIHAINCEEAQRALDGAFDDGSEVPPNTATHVNTCTVCTGYRDVLAAIDLSLSKVPPIQPAPALVAQIQAQIATQRRTVRRPWAYPVAVAAATCLLGALGPVVTGLSLIPIVESGTWLPWGFLLPEWDFLRQELASISSGIVNDFTVLGRWSENTCSSVRGWLTAIGSGYSPWVWALFLVSLAATFTLDGVEWMSRRAHRP